MIGKNVHGVGVELEGWWKTRSGHPIHGDGSVRLADIRERKKSAGFIGEKSSPVFKSIEDLAGWLYKEYPHRRNRTCGFHVNISVEDQTLLRRCANQTIHENMIKAILKYAKSQRFGRAFEQRLKPNAEFSRLGFDPNLKYSAINWSKTRMINPYVEYRIFSQVMPPTKALNAVKFLIGLTDLVAEAVKQHGENNEVRLKEILNY